MQLSSHPAGSNFTFSYNLSNAAVAIEHLTRKIGTERLSPMFFNTSDCIVVKQKIDGPESGDSGAEAFDDTGAAGVTGGGEDEPSLLLAAALILASATSASDSDNSPIGAPTKPSPPA
uniref:Uncharacterized protein n=1 Tax=Kalanchoe fedtschenkoi TaxID=63787 RepID=A0A7N0RJB1_KALFE